MVGCDKASSERLKNEGYSNTKAKDDQSAELVIVTITVNRSSFTIKIPNCVARQATLVVGRRVGHRTPGCTFAPFESEIGGGQTLTEAKDVAVKKKATRVRLVDSLVNQCSVPDIITEIT